MKSDTEKLANELREEVLEVSRSLCQWCKGKGCRQCDFEGWTDDEDGHQQAD